MKQFAIIGVSVFGERILEELIPLECEILLIDKSSEIVEFYKDKVTTAYIANVMNEETIKKLIPVDIDAVIIDLGDKVEVSILVTNYLKKMGIKKVFVRAETNQHGEILELVGADHIVFPNQEAARRTTPLLVSDLLFSYLPIGNGRVMAEVKLPEARIGMSIIEADIRKKNGLNIIGIRKTGGGDFDFFNPDYCFQNEDILLLAGSEENLFQFAGADIGQKNVFLPEMFKRILSWKK